MTTRPSGSRLRGGISYVLQGLRLIRQPKIRWFVLIPLCINIALFSCGIALLVWGLDVAIERFLPDWLEWLKYILWPLTMLAGVLVVFYGFTLLANLIASPFNGMLAQAVEHHLTGKSEQDPFNFRGLGREIARSLSAELRKLGYFLLWAVPFLVLFIIPVVNLIAAPLWFLFGAWMLAVEYVDCPLGNHAQPFPAAREQLRERRRLALGFGAGVMVLTMIPILNFVAMPAAVAGATALYLDELAPSA